MINTQHIMTLSMAKLILGHNYLIRRDDELYKKFMSEKDKSRSHRHVAFRKALDLYIYHKAMSEKSKWDSYQIEGILNQWQLSNKCTGIGDNGVPRAV